MKYIKQFCIIILFSFLGELCRYLIPLPIPASIYGMALMFGALALKLVKPEQVREGGSFLVSCLPVLFVAPAVGLMDYWSQLQGSILPLLVIVPVTTVITFGTAGLVTQHLMNRKGGNRHD